MTETLTLSVRARQALGAAAVESFCRAAHISDADVDLFVAHLWSIVCARDIPRWEEEGRSLAVTGLGDPLPPRLVAKIGSDAATRLARVTEAAYEISMSQIYGAHRPEKSDLFLELLMTEAGLRFVRRDIPPLLAQHDAGLGGWGDTIAEKDLEAWQTAARVAFGN